MDDTTKCSKCNEKMKEINRKRVLTEMDAVDNQYDDDIAEGQMSNSMDEELSGQYDNWGVTEITYKCQKCGNIMIVNEA